MITKALLLFLATMGGAGLLYRGQLQSLVVQGLAALRPPAVSSQNAAQPSAEAAPPANPNRLVAGQFHGTVLDAPATRANHWESTVATASGPAVYPVYRTEVVKQVVVAPPRVIVQHPQQRQTTTTSHRVVLHNGN